MGSKIIEDIRVIIFYLFLIPQAMCFVFSKSHMFVRWNYLEIMYLIYVIMKLCILYMYYVIVKLCILYM